MNRYKVMLASASVLFCGLAWAIPSLDIDENPIPEIPVGYAKVLSVQGDGVARTLGVGKTQPGAKVWSNDYVKAELYATSIAGDQSVPLAVTGKKQTSSSQSFAVYAGSSKISDVWVDSVVADGVTSTATDCGDVYLSYGRFQVLSNDTGEAVCWENLDMFMTEEEDIAKIVKYGDYVAVSNAVCDGEADVVVVTTTGGKFCYGVKATTVTIEKTVVPSTDANDKSNATIRIVTHVLNKPKPRPPKVLFFGTGCGAHDLQQSEMVTAINAIKDVGSVDWYFFKNYNDSDCTKGLHRSGHIDYKGTAITTSDLGKMGGTNEGKHYSLKAFYDQFEAIINDPATSNKYDYVVIETDGSRVANEYDNHGRGGTRSEAQEKKVATWLKPFYDSEKVIWIMDDGYDYQNYLSKYPESSYASAEKLFRYGTGIGSYRVNNVSMKNSGGTTFYIAPLSDTEWMGLKGIFDPSSYLSDKDYDIHYENVKIRISGADSTMETKATYTNPNQLFYHNESKIGGELQQIITPVAYETEMSDTVLNLKNFADVDTIVIPNGLDSVSLYTWSWPAGKSPTEVDPTKWQADVDGWTEDAAKAGLSLGGFTISNRVQNITNDCWRKVEVGIQFKEDFLATAKAKGCQNIKWNAEKQVYEVNPNEGEAVVTLWRGGGESRIKCMATAQATALALEMKDEKKEFDILRAEDAIKTYDGNQTNIVVEVNNTPDGMTIKYRNKGDSEWKDYTPATGYVNVADSTNVEFKVEADGYKTYVGTNAVKIAAAKIDVPKNPSGPDPEEEGPGPGVGPAPQIEPKGPWAAAYNVKKPYDGLGTNITYMAGNLDVMPTFKFAYTEAAPGNDSPDWVDYENIFTNVTYAADGTVGWTSVWVRVTAGNNYTPTNIQAFVKITPLDMTKDGDVAKNGVFAKDQKVDYGKSAPALDGQWTVGKGLVKGDGVKSVDLVITNGVDVSKLKNGDYPGLISTNNANAKPIVITNKTGDVTSNYKIRFTPGTLTIGGYPGMEIGPEGPVQHPPAGEPPIPLAEPGDDPSKTGARNVTKVYDGISTNIEVKVVNPAAGATIEYGYDTNTWYLSDSFPGYTVVTNDAPVWFKITADGYQPITNRAFVTITPKPVDDPTKPGDPVPGTGLDFGGDGKDKVPYKGTEWKPEVTVTNELGTLTSDDYDIEYFDNIDSTNKAGIVITGKGNYTGVFTNYFEITKLKVTITANDQSIVYGSSVPETSFYTFEAKGFTNNETIAILTTQPTFRSDYTTTTPVGPIAIKKATDAVARNYTFDYKNGTLTIGKDSIKIGEKGPFNNENQPPAPPEKENDDENASGVRNVVKTYDGKGTNIIVTVTYPTSGSEVVYSVDGGLTYLPSGTVPSLVNVEQSTQVWYVVTAPGCDPVTNYAWVTIKPKAVTITSATETFVYNGLAQSRATANADGFVDGEGATYSNFNTVTDVAESGIENNSFEYELKSNTKSGNYEITKVNGSLTVKPADIKKPQTPNKPNNPDLPEPPAGSESDPWTAAANIIKCFDNTGTNIVATFKNLMPEGLKPGVLYSTNNVDFVAWESLQFTNVCEGVLVYYRVSDVNYNTLTNSAYVTITNAVITPVGPGDNPEDPSFEPPEDGTPWAGATNVVKVYDGVGTNILAVYGNLLPDGTIPTIKYSTSENGPFADRDPKQFVNVTNVQVYFTVEAPNYATLTNSAFVTITKKNLGGGGGGGNDNAIVADDKSISYGDACPTLTWHGGKGLAPGDSIKTVLLGLEGGVNAKTLAAKVYDDLITTNAAVVIVNSDGKNVTDCYEGFFTPGTLTVGSAEIRYEIEVPNVPYDGNGTNITIKLITEDDPPFKLKYRGPDTPEGVWLDEPPVYTNAGPYEITYMIVDGDNYTPVTNTVTMIISPRKITLKSPSKEKVYDNKFLKLFADELAAGGMGFADGERFNFIDLAKTKEVGTIKATFGYDDNGSASTSNYEVVGFEYGTLRVNPNDEQIVVRSASGTWIYDGYEHSTNDFEIIGTENLYEGDWVTAELKLNKVKTPADGDVTNEFLIAEIYRGTKGDVANSTKVTSEYGDKFKIDEGLLNVVNAKFTDPDVTPYRGLYDGQDHGIKVETPTVPDGSEPSGKAKVDYPDGNVFRDVTNAVVRFTLKANYYDDYEGESTVEILPREVVFTTGDDTQRHGTPAMTPTDIKVSGDGFLAGEGYDVDRRDRQIDVGRADAGFAYTLKSNTKSANYRIRMVKGALTVYDKDKLTVIATNAVHVFDGTEYSNHGVTIENQPAGCTVTPVFADTSKIKYPGEVANRIASVKIMKGSDDVSSEYETVLIDGKLTVTAAKIEGVEVASTNVVYDGKGHSIVVTVPSGIKDPVIEYSTTGEEGPYQSKNPIFTIADPKGDPNKVYVRITALGYEEYLTNGYVTITRRPVTVASAFASRTYDGKALSNDVVQVEGVLDLAAGETLFAVTTASQTEVGSTENAFDYIIADATGAEERTKNYNVTIVNRKLTVEPADIEEWDPNNPSGPEPTGPWVWLEDAVMVYTGEDGTNVAVRSGKFADDLPKLEYKPEGTPKFLPFEQAFTNVMYDSEGKVRWTNVAVRVIGDANYKAKTLTRKVTIKEPPAAEFKAALRWQYTSADTFFASIDITNVNKKAFKYDEGSMRFSFADRLSAGIWLTNMVNLSVIVVEQQDGSLQTNRWFTLSDPVGGWQRGTNHHYGPVDGENLSFVEAFYKYHGATPMLFIRSRNASTNELDGYIGYLEWTAYGVTNSLPLVAGDELPLPRELFRSGKKALSVATLNKLAAYGVCADEESQVTCEITEFEVGETSISGRVVTGNGGLSDGMPSTAAGAIVTLEGTDTIGGEWEDEPVTINDGRFTAEKKHQFYRVRVDVDANRAVFK